MKKGLVRTCPFFDTLLGKFVFDYLPPLSLRDISPKGEKIL
jgi:hypothetical protein